MNKLMFGPKMSCLMCVFVVKNRCRQAHSPKMYQLKINSQFLFLQLKTNLNAEGGLNRKRALARTQTCLFSVIYSLCLCEDAHKVKGEAAVCWLRSGVGG